MRVYIPNSEDRKINRALKELELFKQAVLYDGKKSLNDLGKVINLLLGEHAFSECVKSLREIHHVVDVETKLLVVERLRNVMRELNDLR